MKSPSIKRAFRKDRTGSVTGGDPGVLRRVLSGLGSAALFLGRVFVSGLLDAGLALLVACGCIPVTIVLLSNILGVGAAGTLAEIVFVLGCPVLFTVALWVVFTVWAIRRVNGFLSATFDKIAGIGSGKDGK